MKLLDGEERERALALRTRRQQQAYVAAHALLRTALSAYDPRPPEAWRFVRSPLGEPTIDGAGGIRFSLTHAGARAAVAVGAGRALGVDLETVRSERDPRPLAHRFFTAAEAGWLAALPEGDRPVGFATLWTVKEAVLKARGTGLTEPLRSVAVALDGAGRLHRVDAPGGPWAVTVWSPEAGLSAALAVATGMPLTVSAFRAVPLRAPVPAPELAPPR